MILLLNGTETTQLNKTQVLTSKEVATAFHSEHPPPALPQAPSTRCWPALALFSFLLDATAQSFSTLCQAATHNPQKCHGIFSSILLTYNNSLIQLVKNAYWMPTMGQHGSGNIRESYILVREMDQVPCGHRKDN